MRLISKATTVVAVTASMRRRRGRRSPQSYHRAPTGRTTIQGTNQADQISARAGNDDVDGERGDDSIDGGAGNDNELQGNRGVDSIARRQRARRAPAAGRRTTP